MSGGLVRCKGLGGTGCPDDALTLPGRVCRTCRARTEPKPDPKPPPRKSRRGRIEALIEGANSEVVQAERADRRRSSR